MKSHLLSSQAICTSQDSSTALALENQDNDLSTHIGSNEFQHGLFLKLHHFQVCTGKYSAENAPCGFSYSDGSEEICITNSTKKAKHNLHHNSFCILFFKLTFYNE